MKPAALIISILLLTLVFAVNEAEGSIRNYVRASATGDNASVDVKVNNTFGTNINTSTTKSETSTKIDIDQEGEGTSSVTINGKEYKVEGSGSLHVDEKSTTPTYSPTPSMSTSPTPANVLGESTEEIIEDNRNFLGYLFSSLRNHFRNLLANLF